MPLYDGDLGSGVRPARERRQAQAADRPHQGVFIASPEYNASITPLLKNTLDWVSRVRDGKEPPLAAYKNRVFALGGASNGTYGGMRSLMALRQVLELGCGALVIPEQIAVREAAQRLRRDGQSQGRAQPQTCSRRVVKRLHRHRTEDCMSAPRHLQPRDRLIVALDLPSVARPRRWSRRLGDTVGFYKIGYQLAFAGGLPLRRRA